MKILIKTALIAWLFCAPSFAQDEKCFVWGEDTEAGASVHTECSLVYTKDTDKLFKSDGTTLTELAAGGGGGSDSFVTIATSTGTSPVADTSTDTLTVTCTAPLICTGDSATDTVTFSLTGLVLDLGDDGGNDSTALAEVSTVNDDYSAVTEPSANEMQIDFGKVAPYRQYDPMRPPSSCAICDEFTNGCTLSRSTGNADSTSISCARDGLLIDGDDARDEWTVEWFDPVTGNVDFTVTARIHSAYQQQEAGSGCGLAILHGGSVAAPSALVLLYNSYSTGSATSMLYQTATDYTFAGATNIWNLFPTMGLDNGQAYYYQLRYVDATRVVTATMSKDGQVFNYVDTETTTLSADPIKVGIVSRGAAECFVDFIRMRSDTDRNLAGE